MKTIDSGGWVVLHRKITQWEWYKNATVKELFIHFLLLANHADNKWQGVEIKRGQLVTSLNNLVSETSLSKMQIRYAIKRLILTHEITQQTTTKYTVITVLNYDQYQKDNTQSNKQTTHKQHTSNTRVTLNNNDNNETSKQDSITPLPPTIENLLWLETQEAREYFTQKFPTVDVDTQLEVAVNWLKSEGKRKSDYRAFMGNWCRRCIEKGTGLKPAVRTSVKFEAPKVQPRVRIAKIKSFKEIMAEKANKLKSEENEHA